MTNVDLGDNPLALERQVCYAITIASRNVVGLYRPILKPLNLTHPQYLLMLALWERSPQSVKELATALRAESAALSPMIKRLESIGYVTRTRNAEDERLLAVDLTDTGRKLRDRALDVPYQVVERLGIDLAELDQLREALTRVIAATEQHDITSAAMFD